MERESEGKVSCDIVCELATSSQNLLAGGSSGECQTVARVNLGPEVAAIFLRTLCQAVFVAIQKFLEKSCCLRKCFEKTSSYFWADIISGNCLTRTAPATSKEVLRTSGNLAGNAATNFSFNSLPNL